jgi:hypothetical protein
VRSTGLFTERNGHGSEVPTFASVLAGDDEAKAFAIILHSLRKQGWSDEEIRDAFRGRVVSPTSALCS